MILEPAPIDFAAVGSAHDEKVELALLAVMLLQDVKESADRFNADNSDYAARVLFRSAFAFVEGALFRIRFVILAHAKEGVGHLTPEEVLVLKDEVPSLHDSGKVGTRVSFSQFRPALKFVLKVYARVVGAADAVDFSDARCGALMSSAVVRNRLVHPKHRSHLHVPRSEVDALESGVQWFAESVDRLIGKAVVKSDQERE